MTDQKIDGGKRTWIIASGCAGAVGAGFLAVPFVRSFEPSERARAAGAPVEVDISGIKPGEKMTVEWRTTIHTGLPRHSTVIFSPGLMPLMSTSTGAPA